MVRNINFASLGDAFDALPESMREHSLRVEKYADIIFLELCAAEEYTLNMNSRVRLRTENRSAVRLAARYHDLGKLLVPEIYQWNDPDFNPEELALYRRHCLAGSEFVHNTMGEQSKVDPMLMEMISECILYHHERWDGQGYPRGLAGENIPVLGRIVEVANELDHRLMNTRTETPVETALDTMLSHSATRHDPVIMGLLYEARYKIDKIFALYRHQSQAVEEVTRIIKHKNKRPMWLRYRPIMDIRTNKVAAIEADMQFKRGRAVLPLSEVEPLLRRTRMLWDAGFGFTVEACDMARRMTACRVGGDYVLLPTVPGFFRRRGAANAVVQMLTDTDSDPARLALILTGTDVLEPSAIVLENCQKLHDAGCRLACSGVPLAMLSIENLQKLHISLLKFSPEDVEQIDENGNQFLAVWDLGITMIGENMEKRRTKHALFDNEIHLASGTLVGEFISEDDFISGELALSVR